MARTVADGVGEGDAEQPARRRRERPVQRDGDSTEVFPGLGGEPAALDEQCEP